MELRTRSPRRREPLDPGHQRTGFASRCAGPAPAMAEGVDAGAACSSRVNNETITCTAFRLPKLSRAASGESRLGRVDSNHQLPQSTAPPAKRVSHEDNELAESRSAGTGRKTPKNDPQTVTQPSRGSTPSEDL